MPRPPAKPEPKRRGNLMVWDVSLAAKQRFHEACIHNGHTMKFAITQLMNYYANGWVDVDIIPPARHHG